MLNKLNIQNIKHNQEENIAYRLLIALGIYGTGYYFIFKPLTIGHNINYSLYIVWIPIIVGLIVISWLRKDFFKRLNKTFKSKIDKIITYLFLFIMGLMYSYLSFGITTEIIFQIINKQKIKNIPQTTYNFPVESINSSYRARSASIAFDFNNHSEKIEIDNKLYRELKDKEIDNFNLRIKCRKGMFDVYYIDNWEILIIKN